MTGVKDRTLPSGRAALRVLGFLAEGPASAEAGQRAGLVLLDGEARGTIAVVRDTLAALVRNGLLEWRDRRILLTAAGEAARRRATATVDPFTEQHAELDRQVTDVAGERQAVLINLAESPLAQLVRLKTKDGRPFLCEAEWRAGERLRSDYTRGQIMPRLGANWQAAVSSGRRSGGVAELTDAALACRLRVERAIAAVGPELSGVLIDVCCFLKGLETVERERCWPVRSGKVVLKAALGALSRHYEPSSAGRIGGRKESILHWGTEDYRPTL